jgi:hypothetical protein
MSAATRGKRTNPIRIRNLVRFSLCHDQIPARHRSPLHMRCTRASPAIDAMTIDQSKRSTLQHVSCPAANASTSEFHKVRLADSKHKLTRFSSPRPTVFISICATRNNSLARNELVVSQFELGFRVSNHRVLYRSLWPRAVPVPPVVGLDSPLTPPPPLTSFTGFRSRIMASFIFFLSRRQADWTTLTFGSCVFMLERPPPDLSSRQRCSHESR